MLKLVSPPPTMMVPAADQIINQCRTVSSRCDNSLMNTTQALSSTKYTDQKEACHLCQPHPRCLLLRSPAANLTVMNSPANSNQPHRYSCSPVQVLWLLQHCHISLSIRYVLGDITNWKYTACEGPTNTQQQDTGCADTVYSGVYGQRTATAPYHIWMYTASKHIRQASSHLEYVREQPCTHLSLVHTGLGRT